MTWGNARHGGDSSAVQARLQDVRQIQATSTAWQRNRCDLRGVRQIQATLYAFAAILGNGSVITWGAPDCGGDSSAVQAQFRDARSIQAAILADGSLLAWGNDDFGGDSSAVQTQLVGVQQIQSTSILCNGSIVTWGQHGYGGDLEGMLLSWVTAVAGCFKSFAAILGDGSVEIWGSVLTLPQPAQQAQLMNVQQIQARRDGVGFAAILANGSVVTWPRNAGRYA